ncbi:MAG: hypothetical protein ACR2OW_09650 [Methyloligellaceae bacterium]
MFWRTLLCLSLFLMTAPARGMEFHTARISQLGADVIIANGEIVTGDADRLSKIIRKATRNPQGKYVLYLNSPGGLAAEAFKIARIIQREDFVAVIPPGFSCASACSSIVYFAADHFYVEGTGKLGFHSCGARRQRSDLCNYYIVDHAAGQGVDRTVLSKWLEEYSPRGMKWIGKTEACKKSFCNYPPYLEAHAGTGQVVRWVPKSVRFGIRNIQAAKCQAYAELDSNTKLGLTHDLKSGWRLIVRDEKFRHGEMGFLTARIRIQDLSMVASIPVLRGGNTAEFEIAEFKQLLESLRTQKKLTYRFGKTETGIIDLPGIAEGIELIRNCIDNRPS